MLRNRELFGAGKREFAAPSVAVLKSDARGKDETQSHRQRYQCKNCGAHFDDLTAPIFALPSSTTTSVDPLPVFDGTKQSRIVKLPKS